MIRRGLLKPRNSHLPQQSTRLLHRGAHRLERRIHDPRPGRLRACRCAHPKPENRKPKTETRKLEPGTSNPKPGTRNPKHKTRTPKPGTHNLAHIQVMSKVSSGSGFGFRVPGFGFRVSGSGFRLAGSGSRVPGSNLFALPPGQHSPFPLNCEPPFWDPP